MRNHVVFRMALAMVLLCGFCMAEERSGFAAEKKHKVLVVMSYEEDFPWCREIRKGTDAVLGAESEIRYFYMNTKKNPAGGEEKAKEAFALYQEFHPDGVITADDNAQAMFVLPFLKDRVKTPVMFCGVNAEPEKYGYPASNVSGILEREPFNESLVFVRQMVPDLKTFGALLPDDPTGNAVLGQMEKEKDRYPLRFTGAKTVKSFEYLMKAAEEMKQTADTLFYITFEGLLNAQGQPMSDKEILPAVAKAFGKPVLTNAPFRVAFGALCAVVKTGEEQGRIASEMLLEAMKGKAVADIPITQNKYGLRVINVDTLKALGISPKPEMIRSAQLIKTEK